MWPMTKAIQNLLSQYGTEWHLLAAGAFISWPSRCSCSSACSATSSRDCCRVRPWSGVASRPTVRVATWNIRAAIGPGEPFPPAWWRHVRRERLERIAAQIVALDADVVALQEVALLTPNGDLLDQPLELARLTGRHVRYSAVHAFALIEPETAARSARDVGQRPAHARAAR